VVGFAQNGATMTRRQFYGTARENTFWILIVMGSFVFCFFGLRAFPWLHDEGAFLIRLIGAGYGISLLAVFAARRKLFPWVSQVPWFEWFAMLTLPVVGAFYLVGAFLVLNGVLDRAPARDTRFVVIGGDGRPDFRIAPLDRLQEPASVLWVRRGERELHVNSVVSVSVRRGAFGHPWVGGYRAVAPDYRRVLVNEHP
jgi:multisubunit Na+/H+ antiporter MnhE subunit